MEWAPSRDNQIYDDVTLARLAQNLETPLEERIEMATWPEVLLYFSTAAMDDRYVGRDLSELYQYSFRRYLEKWTPLEPDEQPPPLNKNPELTNYQLDRLDDLRFGIKKDRDKYFVDEVYDDWGVDGVPKSFWLTDYELDRVPEESDDMAQSALQDF